jgi:hypothetical protein
VPIASAAGVANAHDFGVGGGIAALNPEVVAGGDNGPGRRASPARRLVVGDEYRADRDAAFSGSLVGFGDRGVKKWIVD